jgi:hypothetical protein
VDAFLYSGDTTAKISSILLVESLAKKQAVPLMFSAEDNGFIEDNPWTWSGCFFFATTIASTIGYGTWAPATLGGKIFTIFYALFSVGIFGVITSAIGESLIESGMVFLRAMRYAFSKPPAEADFGAKDHARAGFVFLVFVLVVNIFYCASPKKYFGFLNDGETSNVSVLADYFWFSPVATVNSIYFWVVTVTSVGLGDFAHWPLTHALDVVMNVFLLIVPMGVLGGVYGALTEMFFAWWHREKEDAVDSNQTDHAIMPVSDKNNKVMPETPAEMDAELDLTALEAPAAARSPSSKMGNKILPPLDGPPHRHAGTRVADHEWLSSDGPPVGTEKFDNRLEEALAFITETGSELSCEINQHIADEKLLSQAQKDAVISEYETWVTA